MPLYVALEVFDEITGGCERPAAPGMYPTIHPGVGAACNFMRGGCEIGVEARAATAAFGNVGRPSEPHECNNDFGWAVFEIGSQESV